MPSLTRNGPFRVRVRNMQRDFYFQRNQTRLTTTSNVEAKTDHTRNRQPIIVPNDDYENNNTSSVNIETIKSFVDLAMFFRAHQRCNKRHNNTSNNRFRIIIK